jgi:hypothetical protein
MKTSFSLFLLSFIVCTSMVVHAQDSAKVLIISPRVGPEIDSLEREQFGLFRSYPNFSRAIFYFVPDSTFFVRIEQKTPSRTTDTTVFCSIGFVRMLAEKVDHYEGLLDGTYHMGDEPATLQVLGENRTAADTLLSSPAAPHRVGTRQFTDSSFLPITSSAILQYNHLKLKPMFFGDAMTGAAFMLTAKFKTNNHTLLVFEIPFATGSYPYYTLTYVNGTYLTSKTTRSDNNFGNPYVGLEMYSTTAPSHFDVGVWLPVLKRNSNVAPIYGMFSDIDHMEAFVPNQVSLQAMYNFGLLTSPSFSLQGGIGPSVWIKTKSVLGEHDADLLFSYAVQPCLMGKDFELSLGFTGRINATADVANFSDRVIDQYRMSFSLQFGKVRPGIQFRIPANDNLKSLIDNVIGVSLQYDFD